MHNTAGKCCVLYCCTISHEYKLGHTQTFGRVHTEGGGTSYWTGQWVCLGGGDIITLACIELTIRFLNNSFNSHQESGSLMLKYVVSE